jgi:hypothetical protein
VEYSESLNHGQLVPAGLTRGSAFSSFLFRPLFELPAIPNNMGSLYRRGSLEAVLSVRFFSALSLSYLQSPTTWAACTGGAHSRQCFQFVSFPPSL